jgi:hypothetical protein
MTSRAQERVEGYYSEPRGYALLLFGFFGGALAWKAQLMVNYSLVAHACWHDLSILIHLASLVCLLIAVAAGWAAWGAWKETEGPPYDEGGDDHSIGGQLGRSRFMAASGVMMSIFFALVIAGQWLPNLLLSPCFGIG